MAVFADVIIRGVEVTMSYLETVDSFVPADEENYIKFVKAIGLENFSYLAIETEDEQFIINVQDLDTEFQDQIKTTDYVVTEEYK